MTSGVDYSTQLFRIPKSFRSRETLKVVHVLLQYTLGVFFTPTKRRKDNNCFYKRLTFYRLTSKGSKDEIEEFLTCKKGIS